MNIQRKKGFTLIEMIVTVSIFTMMTGALYTIFLVGNKSWTTFSTNVILQHDVREGLFAMTKELRRARDILIIKEESGTKINFLRWPVGLVSYSWSSEGVDANKIVRTNNGNVRVLADNISALSLESLPNAVVIDMTASQILASGPTSQFQLKEKVALRSKVYEDKQ